MWIEQEIDAIGGKTFIKSERHFWKVFPIFQYALKEIEILTLLAKGEETLGFIMLDMLCSR